MAMIALLFIVASAAAQPGIRPPQLGFAGDADGTLRPVYGVAGNFILGPAISDKVISQAFSGSLGLLKTESTLAAFDGEGKMLATIDAAAGPALFAFSPDGLAALAYVPSSNTLVEWKAGQLVTMPFHPELGTVLAVALSNAFEASLIVQREDGIWEVQSTSQNALADVTAPVLALASGELVYSDARGIVLRNPESTEVHIAAQLPTKFSLQQMDSEWVQLSDLATPRRFAIRVVPGREGFYQLPQAKLREVRR
jgi:hypothetical protein